MRTLRFTVVGVAAPQGSYHGRIGKGKDGQPQAFVTHDNPKTKGWRGAVASAAAFEMLRPENYRRLFGGAIELEVVFHLPRPKTLRTKRLAFVDVPHTTKPDADKLARAAKDALSKVVWHDDAQVTDLIARKRYTAEGAFPRAVITVREYANSVQKRKATA